MTPPRFHLATSALLLALALLLGPASALAQGGAPPARLNSWVLGGELLEDEDTVLGFLRPVLRDHEAWTRDDQEAVKEMLATIGYHCTIINDRLSTGGVRATFQLKPITLVRTVDVELDLSLWKRAKQPIFAEEIQRRMTLRPGSALPDDETERTQILQDEAAKIRDYLIYDGFYDASVSVSELALGPHTSTIRVKVNVGRPYFIGKITVSGNSAIDSDTITEKFVHDRICVPIFGCYGTRRFSRSQLNKDRKAVERLYKQRGFPGVRITTDFKKQHSFHRDRRRVDFHVEVRERRRIEVTFDGNSAKFKTPDLEAQLTLAKRGSYDDVEVENSAESLRSYYQSRGYFETQINWEREYFPDMNFERILFYIDEGPQLKVRSVAFRGNKELKSKTLRSELKTRIYRKLIVGKSGGFATTGQLQQDVQRILRRYQAEGFREARVRLEVARDKRLLGSASALAAAVAGSAKADGLHVVFHIDEGPRTTVDEVRFVFDGTHSLSEGSLRTLIKLKAGSNFLERVVKEDSSKLQRHYLAIGFPRVEVKTEFLVEEHRVTIVHTIKENSPARIGKIAIRGNFKTSDWIIRDLLEFQEGDLKTIVNAERAQSNLRQTGLFSTVQVTFVGQENPRQEVVNVLVRVEERHDHTGHGLGGIGYATDSSIFVEGKVESFNLFGIGATGNIRAVYGIEQQVLQARFALPTWVMDRAFGTELQFDTLFSYNNIDTERFGELQTLTGGFGISKQWLQGLGDADWLLSLRYNYRRRNRDVDLVRPAGNSDDITQAKVTSISSAAGPVLFIDNRRDRNGDRNPLTPAKGYRVNVGAQFAEDYLLGTDRFIKLNFSGQHFIPIGPYLKLSNGFRWDHGIPLGGASLLPEVERFFGGGDTTVRGYEEDRLATELIQNDLAPIGGVSQFRVVPAGGNIRMIHNLDLELQVWEDPFLDLPISSAIFLDTGLITNSLVDFDPDQLRYGLGVALLRWTLPIGSLSFEYALPLNPRLGDNQRGRYHVNVGLMF